MVTNRRYVSNIEDNWIKGSSGKNKITFHQTAALFPGDRDYKSLIYLYLIGIYY